MAKRIKSPYKPATAPLAQDSNRLIIKKLDDEDLSAEARLCPRPGMELPT
jgi:hypothetical protein